MSTPERYHHGIRLELKPFIPQTYSKVLEIGCGEGHFRHNLSVNCEYWGIEPSNEAANKAKQHISKILTGTYDEVKDMLPANYFDLIICNDVIEHMPDHDAFLSEIKEKLSTDGYIFGSIPNVRFIENLIELLFKRDWKYKDDGVLDRTHLRFFTKKSLERTFLQHNYKVETLQGINTALPKLRSLKKIIKHIIMRLIELITLGGSKDIRYLQFVFIISKK